MQASNQDISWGSTLCAVGPAWLEALHLKASMWWGTVSKQWSHIVFTVTNIPSSDSWGKWARYLWTRKSIPSTVPYKRAPMDLVQVITTTMDVLNANWNRWRDAGRREIWPWVVRALCAGTIKTAGCPGAMKWRSKGQTSLRMWDLAAGSIIYWDTDLVSTFYSFRVAELGKWAQASVHRKWHFFLSTWNNVWVKYQSANCTGSEGFLL